MEILPDHGAALNALFAPDLKRENFTNIIDGYSTPDEAEKVGDSFKGVLLFPFGNRLKLGKLNWKGAVHPFEINEPARTNALHGILYNRSFDVIETSTSNQIAKVHLRYSSDGSDLGFPFLYDVEVEYELSSHRGLEIKTTIANRGEVDFPFGLGWHPYFRTGNPINALLLKLPEVEILEVDEQMLPTGKSPAFDRFESETCIGNEVLDSGFRIKSREKMIATLLDPASNIQISLSQVSNYKDFDYIQVYTPPHRESIALEPMTHPANMLSDNPNSGHIVSFGEKRSFAFLIGY